MWTTHTRDIGQGHQWRIEYGTMSWMIGGKPADLLFNLAERVFSYTMARQREERSFM